MRTRLQHLRTGILVITLASAMSIGCSPPPSSPGDGEVGTVGFELQIAPGVTISTISWNVANAGTGFSQSGTVNVQNSNTIRFQVGGVPAGTGYTITLNATSVGGAFTCNGSTGFDVAAGMTTSVSLTLTCQANGNGSGSVVVSGTTAVCATITGLSVLPLETTVNGPIALSATATAGPLTPTFAWTATAGSFDNAASATPVFTCPATPATVTITLAVSPTAPGCTSATRTVDVVCDTLNPTFTNVYANVIGARCTGCHRPGAGGVTVGMLDMSTQAAAYANLVGVPSAGTGAGTSGITCASIAMARVSAGNATGSLLYNKVASKLAGVNAACGSPMPLPASAVALTQAQVDLIAAWIGGGALND
jgi:mono/diheme cytochrome c family protein